MKGFHITIPVDKYNALVVADCKLKMIANWMKDAPEYRRDAFIDAVLEQEAKEDAE